MTIDINDTEHSVTFLCTVSCVVLCNVALTFECVMKSSCVTKATEQYFSVMLFINLYKLMQL